jgi:hypothetical protein
VESFIERRPHPLLAGAAIIEAALDDMAAGNPVFLESNEKREALLQLTRLEARLASVRLQVMAVADDLAAADGARDVAAWLAHETRSEGADRRRDLALADALDRRWELVAVALAAGEINVAQAVVITRALDELPRERISPEITDTAEAHLVAEARELGPRELRLLGRKVLEVVAPEVFELEEARQLEAEERRASERTSLTM